MIVVFYLTKHTPHHSMRSMLVRQRCVPFNSQYVRTLRRNVSTLTEGSVDRSLGPSEQKPSTQGKQNVELTLSSPYKLKLEDYCLYRDTQAPRPSQLEYADHFFAATKHSPVHLWASSQFRTIPVSLLPEVAFIGRSNVGKSSIINALVGEDICASSSKPGRTRTITSIGVGGTKGGGSKIALVDTPGYGKGSHTEWGQEIQKYLEKRKQ